jgi:hypothetical protein
MFKQSEHVYFRGEGVYVESNTLVRLHMRETVYELI